MGQKMRFGDYPLEYDPKRHGAYDPSYYYGKRKFQFSIHTKSRHSRDFEFYTDSDLKLKSIADKPFFELKVNEVSAWIGRRPKNFWSTMHLLSRWRWRYVMKYYFANRGPILVMYHAFFWANVFFYVTNSGIYRAQKNSKYH